MHTLGCVIYFNCMCLSQWSFYGLIKYRGFNQSIIGKKFYYQLNLTCNFQILFTSCVLLFNIYINSLLRCLRFFFVYFCLQIFLMRATHLQNVIQPKYLGCSNTGMFMGICDTQSAIIYKKLYTYKYIYISLVMIKIKIKFQHFNFVSGLFVFFFFQSILVFAIHSTSGTSCNTFSKATDQVFANTTR